MKKEVCRVNKRILAKGLLLGAGLIIGLSMQQPVSAAAATEIHSLSRPNALYSTSDSLFVLDGGSNVIYALEAGEFEAIIGKSGVENIYGDADGDYLDGSYLKSYFDEPYAMAPYKGGYAITDVTNNVIRFAKKGKVTTLAGNKKAGLKDGKKTKARFNNPKGIAADDKGNLYVADCLNNVIRKIDTKGNVTTFAGSKKGGYKNGTVDKALFLEPAGLCWYKGALYVADGGNHCIRVIKDGVVETVAGGKNLTYKGTKEKMGDYKNGSCKNALFNRPESIVVKGNAIYVADSGNGAVRKIKDNKVTTIVKIEGDEFYPVKPKGIAFYNGKLYVGDYYSGMVFSIKKSVWNK
ncbi:MAG: hypothetical protein K6E56_04620 [Lachnospiraceae bacterium]|nr:hypothetical protein [Lachnospiraceae bacterium]